MAAPADAPLLFLLQNAGGAGGLLEMLPMIAIFIGIFYFILIRPQQRERKTQEAMRSSLKRGDEVLTQGGIIAKVRQVEEKFVVLDLEGGDARIRVVREAIVRRLLDPEEVASAKSARDDKNDRQVDKARIEKPAGR